MNEKSLIGVSDVMRLTKYSFNAIRAWIRAGKLKEAPGQKLRFRLMDTLHLPLNSKVTKGKIRAFIRCNNA